MLSKRMTANRRDENPEIHASKSTANVIKLLQPAVLRFIIVDLVLFIVYFNLVFFYLFRSIFRSGKTTASRVFGRTFINLIQLDGSFEKKNYYLLFFHLICSAEHFYQ